MALRSMATGEMLTAVAEHAERRAAGDGLHGLVQAHGEMVAPVWGLPVLLSNVLIARLTAELLS